MRAGRRARIALVGVGRIGRQHALAIARSQLITLVGAADSSPRALDAVADMGIYTAHDVDALLEAVEFDAAIVAVPSAHHVAVVTQLLDARIPVLCEKPGGVTSADVATLQAHAEALGVPLQVGYWRRFVPGLRRVAERIWSRGFGKVATVMAIQWDGEPPSAAFRDPASSGGILVDMGVHEFDMLRWLTGQELADFAGYPAEVSWAPPVPGDPETVNLVARLSGGTTAIISLGRRHPPGDLCRLEVVGGDDCIALPYLSPGNGQAMLLDALQAQAESFARVARVGEPEGATAADATAALLAAEQAALALGITSPAAAAGAAP